MNTTTLGKAIESLDEIIALQRKMIDLELQLRRGLLYRREFPNMCNKSTIKWIGRKCVIERDGVPIAENDAEFMPVELWPESLCDSIRSHPFNHNAQDRKLHKMLLEYLKREGELK